MHTFLFPVFPPPLLPAILFLCCTLHAWAKFQHSVFFFPPWELLVKIRELGENGRPNPLGYNDEVLFSSRLRSKEEGACFFLKRLSYASSFPHFSFFSLLTQRKGALELEGEGEHEGESEGERGAAVITRYT